jgi:hypothetical protein
MKKATKTTKNHATTDTTAPMAQPDNEVIKTSPEDGAIMHVKNLQALMLSVFEDGKLEEFKEGKDAGLNEGHRISFKEGKKVGQNHAEEVIKKAYRRGELNRQRNEQKRWTTAGHAEHSKCNAGQKPRVNSTNQTDAGAQAPNEVYATTTTQMETALRLWASTSTQTTPTAGVSVATQHEPPTQTAPSAYTFSSVQTDTTPARVSTAAQMELYTHATASIQMTPPLSISVAMQYKLPTRTATLTQTMPCACISMATWASPAPQAPPSSCENESQHTTTRPPSPTTTMIVPEHATLPSPTQTALSSCKNAFQYDSTCPPSQEPLPMPKNAFECISSPSPTPAMYPTNPHMPRPTAGHDAAIANAQARNHRDANRHVDEAQGDEKHEHEDRAQCTNREQDDNGENNDEDRGDK